MVGLVTELTPDVQAQIDLALRDQDGWWVRAVLSAFDVIAKDFDYSVEKVRMHFRGNYVWYRGSIYRIALELDRESSVLIGELWLLEDLGRAVHPRVLSIPNLLEIRAPTQEWQPRDSRHGLTEDEVRSVLERWAVGLVTLAPEILAGELPADAPWGRLW
jgi:hypothetical protein